MVSHAHVHVELRDREEMATSPTAQGLRRRKPETLRAAQSSVDEEQKTIATGYRLFDEAQNSGFSNTKKLEESLDIFCRAAEDGVAEAYEWVKSFLDSVPALPKYSVPQQLFRRLQRVSDASRAEQQIQDVARSMFKKMAGDSDSIPRAGMDAAVQRLFACQSALLPDDKASKSKELRQSLKDLLYTAMAISNKDEVDEAALCEAATCYMRGRLLTLHEASKLSDDELTVFKQSNFLKKAYDYPWQALEYSKQKVLKYIEQRSIKWLWSSFPTKQFYLLLIACILPMLSIRFILGSVFTVIFSVAFGVMSFSTLQIITDSEKIYSFLEYSSVFKYFSTSNGAVDTRAPQSLLLYRCMWPYLAFFSSLIVCGISRGLALEYLLFYELFTIIASFFCMIIFFEFQIWKSPLVLLSISSRLIPLSYAFLVMLSEYLPVPDFLFFASGEIVSLPVVPGYLYFSVTLINLVQMPVQVLVLILLVKKTSRNNFYSVFGPYALFSCWLMLSRLYILHSSPYYLSIIVFGSVFMLSSLPFLPFIAMAAPFYVLFVYGLSKPFFVSLVIVSILIALLVVIGRNFSRLKEAKWLSIRLDYIVMAQIFVTAPLLIWGGNVYYSTHSPASLPAVTSQQYWQYCAPHNWKSSKNMVQTQLDCLHLEGRLLSAEGTVESVKIARITNTNVDSLRSLPTSMQTVLTCFFGVTKPSCGDRKDMPTCVGSACNFHNLDKFTFEVGLQLFQDVSVSLEASHYFQPTALELAVGNSLRFNGTFLSGMGTDKLQLKLSAVFMDGEWFDGSSESAVEEKAKKYMLSGLWLSLKNTVLFIMEVTFGYTSSSFYDA